MISIVLYKIFYTVALWGLPLDTWDTYFGFMRWKRFWQRVPSAVEVSFYACDVHLLIHYSPLPLFGRVADGPTPVASSVVAV